MPTVILPNTPGASYSPPPLPTSVQAGLATGVYKELGQEFGLRGGADTLGHYEFKPYAVPWVYRFDFMGQMYGLVKSEGVPNTGDYLVFRNLPYPLPGMPGMYPKAATYVPYAGLEWGQVDPILYSYAIVTIEYRSYQFDPNGATLNLNQQYQNIDPSTPLIWCRQSFKKSGEFIQVPTRNLKFASDSAEVASPISIKIQNAVIQLEFQNLPYMPTYQLQLATNLINSSTFLSFPRGTVRFDGIETTETSMSDGTRAQQATVMFEWRQYDWNMFLRDDKLVWDYVQDGSGNYPYTYGDLTPLLFQELYPTNQTGGM